jgi:hypothetical protein
MVLKIRIGSGIGKLSVNSELDESAESERKLRFFFSKNAYFSLKKFKKCYKKYFVKEVMLE